MMHSMTGFGRAEHSANGWHCAVELRSVNGRYLEVRLRLPNGLAALEEGLRGRIKARLERGRVDGTITLAPEAEGEASLRVNQPMLRALGRTLGQVEAVLERPVVVSLGDLLGVRELVQFDAWEDARAAVEALIGDTLEEALNRLVTMRRTEGEALLGVLRAHGESLQALIDEIEPLTRNLPELYAQRLREQLTRLAGSPPPEERVAQEIALLAERSDVTEEIARFRTHLEHLERILAEPGPVGRKTEFLLQELNREANTLGTKSNDAQVSAKVIQIKSELEKLREQIQNVE